MRRRSTPAVIGASILVLRNRNIEKLKSLARFYKYVRFTFEYKARGVTVLTEFKKDVVHTYHYNFQIQLQYNSSYCTYLVEYIP